MKSSFLSFGSIFVSKNSLSFLVWIPDIGILWFADTSRAISSKFGVVFQSFELIIVHAVVPTSAVQSPQT